MLILQQCDYSAPSHPHDLRHFLFANIGDPLAHLRVATQMCATLLSAFAQLVTEGDVKEAGP